MNITIDKNTVGEWSEIINGFATEQWCIDLFKRVNLAYSDNNLTVYPEKSDLFTALKLTAPQDVKCVIIGQDPYHQPHQAHGLAFSVQNGVKIPPSLRNIKKELQSDLNIVVNSNGNLTSWAKNGVLLLNNTLTVYDSQPNSHKKFGWDKFTDRLIQALENYNHPIVFILWGRDAQNKVNSVNPQRSKHPRLIIQSAHPSPLSANKGFFGSKPFSKTNEFLLLNNVSPIDWAL